MTSNLLPDLIYDSLFGAVDSFFQYMTSNANDVGDGDFLHLEDARDPDSQATSLSNDEIHPEDTREADSQEGLLTMVVPCDAASNADSQESSYDTADEEPQSEDEDISMEEDTREGDVASNADSQESSYYTAEVPQPEHEDMSMEETHTTEDAREHDPQEPSHAFRETYQREPASPNFKPLFYTVNTCPTGPPIEPPRGSIFSSIFQMIASSLSRSASENSCVQEPEHVTPPPSPSARPRLVMYYNSQEDDDAAYVERSRQPLINHASFTRYNADIFPSSLSNTATHVAAHEYAVSHQPLIDHSSFRCYDADVFRPSSSLGMTQDTRHGPIAQEKVDALFQEKEKRQPRAAIMSSLKRSPTMTANTRYSARVIHPVSGAISRRPRQRSMVSCAKPSSRPQQHASLSPSSSDVNTSSSSSTKENGSSMPTLILDSNESSSSSSHKKEGSSTSTPTALSDASDNNKDDVRPSSPVLMPPPPPVAKLPSRYKHYSHYSKDAKWEDILTKDQIKSFTRPKRKLDKWKISSNKDETTETKRRRVNDWLGSIDPPPYQQ